MAGHAPSDLRRGGGGPPPGGGEEPPAPSSSPTARQWRSRVTLTVEERWEEGEGGGGGEEGAGEAVLRVNEFRVLRLLGRGSFGVVYLCERVVGPPGAARRRFAMKIVDKEALASRREYVSTPAGLQRVTMLERVEAEVALQSTLFSRHIPLLFEILHTEESMYLVFELAEHGECMEWDAATQRFAANATLVACSRGPRFGGGLPMQAAARLFRGAARALLHLRGLLIAHGDVKPANLLVAEGGKARLGDFGEARRFESRDVRVSASRGTQAFWPPECATGACDYDPFLADAWALGVTLYAMVFARLPFFADSPQKLLETIARCELALPDEAAESEPDLCDLLRRMLNRDEEHRIPLEEAEAHPWARRWAPDHDTALQAKSEPLNGLATSDWAAGSGRGSPGRGAGAAAHLDHPGL